MICIAGTASVVPVPYPLFKVIGLFLNKRLKSNSLFKINRLILNKNRKAVILFKDRRETSVKTSPSKFYDDN